MLTGTNREHFAMSDYTSRDKKEGENLLNHGLVILYKVSKDQVNCFFS